MAITTRKPTGKPAWPILVLAGREGAGKTWAAITASASELVDRTLYIGVGEDDPDEYALIPGADFDIVVHDGSYGGIRQAVKDAVAEPAGEKPTLLIFDSGTRLWNLIGDNAQAIANQRAKGRRNATTGDYTISPDLWNAAASQWTDIMDALRAHKGPVIVTARLDSVTVMEDGQPTKEKEWKVQAHKSLVFDAGVIIEMHERGHYRITKVKSARVQLDKPAAYANFTVEGLWERLGLAEGTGERAHATLKADEVADPAASARVARAVEAINACTTAEELDAIEKRARALLGVAAVKQALEAKRAEVGRVAGDPWAAEGDPAASTEMTNDEYEAAASAQSDAEKAGV